MKICKYCLVRKPSAEFPSYLPNRISSVCLECRDKDLEKQKKKHRAQNKTKNRKKC